MTDRNDVLEATEVLVRDLGREQAKRDLQQRLKTASGSEQDRILAALAALKKGEVT